MGIYVNPLLKRDTYDFNLLCKFCESLFLSVWTCQYLNRLTTWTSDKRFMDEVKFYFVDKFKILGACSIFLMLTVSSSNLGSLYFGHKQMIQWSKGFMQILFLWMRALTTKSSKSSLDAWVGEATNLIKTPLYSGDCPKGFLFARVSAEWVSIYAAKY